VAPEEIEFRAGGVRLRALRYGRPGGRAMVLVHGIRDHAWSLDPVARAFAGEFQVLAPHLRGHGTSERPGSYAMAEFVADLCALVDHQGLARPVLVGHSLGGQIVTHYAGLFDEAPAAVVTIEGLGPPRTDAALRQDGRRAALRARVRMLLAEPEGREPFPDLALALEHFRRRNPKLSPERARLLVEHGTEPHPGGGLRWRWAPEANRVWSTVSLDENEERWSWIRCPVLVVQGALSSAYWTRRGLAAPVDAARVRADLERKLARFADAELVEIAEADHMVHYDRPEALVAAMRDFLKRRLAPVETT
jgi:pimeloyl-ACP methyl ester carboxylesterase